MYFIFDKNKLPSYYWIFPLSENTFNIGVYFDKKSKPLLNKSDSILDYFKKVGVLSDFTENAEEISKPVAYHIPFNSKVSKNLIGNKYIVIGTSAGLTDPITGEGIGQAIKSGIIASKILNRIDTDFIDFIQQGEYIKELQKQITNKTKQSRKIQRLFSIKGITVISFFMIRNFIFVNWLFSNTNRIRSFLNNKS
jgi:flavin-dependent dehydrogenase